MPAGSITAVMDSSSAPAIDPAFAGMSFAEVCALALQQQAQIKHISAVNAKMAHEMAVLKRLKFAATSERFSPEQKSLLEEAIDEDLAALEREVGDLDRAAKQPGEKQTPTPGKAMAHLGDAVGVACGDDAVNFDFPGITRRRTAMETNRSSSPLHLAYLVVEARRPERWSVWSDTMLGAPPPSHLVGGGQGWRIDDAAHRLIVQQGPSDDLAAMGWACQDDAALDALLARLRSRRVPVAEATPAEREGRRVKRLHRLRDPEGNAIELVVGLARADLPFASQLFPGGFRSDGTGFGHIALVARDLEAMQRFYVDELGFAVTEQLDTRVGPLHVRGRFLHCNARHHSLALMALPLPKRLHHVMFEARDWRDVGAAFDRARRAKVPLSLDLGQHPDPDGTFSFYGATPSGFDFEIGAGGRDIEPATWRPLQSSVTSRWGHRPQLRLQWMTLLALLTAPWRRLRLAVG